MTIISDKIDFKTKILVKTEIFYNDKRINLSERYNSYNIYAPNSRALEYKDKKLTKINGK